MDEQTRARFAVVTDEGARLARLAHTALYVDDWDALSERSRKLDAEVAAAVAAEVRRQERAKLAVLLEAAREMVEATDGHDEVHLYWPLGWERFCAALAALEETG